MLAAELTKYQFACREGKQRTGKGANLGSKVVKYALEPNSRLVNATREKDVASDDMAERDMWSVGAWTTVSYLLDVVRIYYRHGEWTDSMAAELNVLKGSESASLAENKRGPSRGGWGRGGGRRRHLHAREFD